MRDARHTDKRGDKPAQKAKAGLEMPMGNAHWEDKISDTTVADTRYASEMNTCEEYKEQVDAQANYVKRNKMKY